MIKNKKFLSLSLFIFIAFAFFFIGKNQEPNRNIKKSKKMIFTGKVRTAFSNEIELISKNEERVRLKASVYRRSNQEAFDYFWILPKNVRLIEGKKEGHISDTSKQEYQFLVEVEASDWKPGEVYMFKVKTASHLGRTASWQVPETFSEEGFKIQAAKKIRLDKEPSLPKGVKVMQ